MQLSDDVVLDIYKKMVTLRVMDEQLYKAQRMVGDMEIGHRSYVVLKQHSKLQMYTLV